MPFADQANGEPPTEFVYTLEPKALAEYALSVRSSDPSVPEGETFQCIAELPPIFGRKNVVFSITFSDGARWALRIPYPPYSELIQDRMRADIATTRFIQARTDVPIPKIHAALPTVDSPIGVPFILMDWARGVCLEDVWYDRKWRTEPRTRGVIESLAPHMAALNALEFPSIGTLIPQNTDPDSTTWSVGPFIDDRNEMVPNSANLNKCGPYNSVHAYYVETIENAARRLQSRHGRAQLALLRMLSSTLPSFEFDGPPFVLNHPDLCAKNVFVDPATGVITALIDWDGVNTGPRQSGCARYPSWMTKDMNPFRYTWKATYGDFLKEPVQSVIQTRAPSPVPPEDVPQPGPSREPTAAGATNEEPDRDPFTFDWNESLSSSDASSWFDGGDDASSSKSSIEIIRTEESPTELGLLRKTYLAFMKLMYPSLASLTERSHISEAIERAIFDPESRPMIISKLFEELVGPGSAWWIARTVRKGLWNGTWLSNGWVGPVAGGAPPTEVLSGGEVEEADD
ncbi:uncharacterized protein EI90DRAFT_3019231 [Cantharellus anzutake]|uniref:uncharacterized protein n=1 Tax=Cantharellus anzutake TaxID=1750568 RepID=UPI0019052D9C|nr:uncharacterized protein EI90DRAFT_3019231 [Cantharellus anzutake]KAF8325282.1 hypothetical protein EI90DRAFT_3019231 [Cantharellus anzutake]